MFIRSFVFFICVTLVSCSTQKNHENRPTCTELIDPKDNLTGFSEYLLIETLFAASSSLDGKKIYDELIAFLKDQSCEVHVGVKEIKDFFSRNECKSGSIGLHMFDITTLFKDQEASSKSAEMRISLDVSTPVELLASQQKTLATIWQKEFFFTGSTEEELNKTTIEKAKALLNDFLKEHKAANHDQLPAIYTLGRTKENLKILK